MTNIQFLHINILELFLIIICGENMFAASKKIYLIILFVIAAVPLQILTKAQDKQLTFNQVYMFGEPRILKQVPRLQG
jgi:hypothetical protein